MSASASRFALRAVTAYAFFGALWILASDRLLAFVLDVGTLTRLSTVKGLLFVAVTTALLAFSLWRVRQLSREVVLPRNELSWERWRRWPGYALAVLLVLLSGELRDLLLGLGGPGGALLLLVYVPAIMVSALLGGVGVGLLATAVAIGGGLLDVHQAALRGSGDALAILQFVLLALTGAATSLIAEYLHRARRYSEQQAALDELTLSSIADGVIRMDEHDRIVDINAAAAALVGRDPAALRGQPLAEILREAGPPEAIRQPAHVLLACAGQTREVSLRHSPIISGTRLFGSVLVLHDETETRAAQRELAKSRDLLNSIVEGSSDAIFAKDREGRYLLFNRNGARMVGLDPAQAIGRDDHSLFPSADADLVIANDRAIMARGEVVTQEERLTLADGQTAVFLATKGPIHDEAGAVVGLFGISRDITERVRQAEALAQSRQQLRTLIEQAPLSIAMFDRDMRYLVVSALWQANFGRGRESLVGASHYEVIPDQPPRWREIHQRGLAGESLHQDLDCWERADGSRVWMRWTLQPWRDGRGEIGGIIIANEDLSERMRLLEQQRINSVALETADAIVITDADGIIEQVNRAYCELTGYSVEEAIGRKPGDLVGSQRQDAEFYRAMWRDLGAHGVWRGELWNRRKSGEVYPEFLSITAVRAPDGTVTHYVGVIQDISQRKRAEEIINHLAYYDALTDLPNRRLLLDRLAQAVSTCERSGRHGAVLFLDLDNFKNLNDSLGHAAGDRWLVEVARRATGAVRQSDTVARLGGDEFVLLLEDLDGDPARAANDARGEADRVSAAIHAPWDYEGQTFRISPSIGIAMFHGGASAEDLLRQADLAMYQAKSEGKHQVRFFDNRMQVAVERRSRLLSELYDAIEAQQFTLHYQPQVDPAGHVVGVEALLRWQRQDGILVSPQEFIPLAEESGLILTLGHEALNQACRQLAHWQRDPRLAHLSVAVNVSARQFRDEGFVRSVLAALADAGADPARLKLELTESVLLDHVERAVATMQALRQHGIGFALDDFGTGFSSLSYLKRLPLEQLKIDQSFVTDLLNDANDAVIARSIIALAKSLGLSVIAEGVESAAVWQRLLDDGCDFGQGYLFGRPLPADALGPQIEQRLPPTVH